MTPPAKAGGFLRSVLHQQRLPYLRTDQCPTLAIRGSIQALCQCDWRHAPAYDHSISFTQAESSSLEPTELILLSRCGLLPVDRTPLAIEAERQEEPYDLTVENVYLSGLRPCPIPLPAKAGSPLEHF